MVNCNPETVSTDYDTSDRLYFEPLGWKEVLAVCERERPEGVAIQFGGQTPLKLRARARSCGYSIIGTPFDAVTSLRTASASVAPRPSRHPLRSGGSHGTTAEARAIAERIGFPIPDPPSYVLGGRRCVSANSPGDLGAIESPVLIDRFIESALEIDVDAVSDGLTRTVGAVMQHVERRACTRAIRPACYRRPRQPAATRRYVRCPLRSHGRSRGRSSMWHLAVVEGSVYVLEANPRASRTVPSIEGDGSESRRGGVPRPWPARTCPSWTCSRDSPSDTSR